ncbi:MAG: hypothetical protein BWX52_01595 [Bacteroidetes bacterium ADurb.Bin013]|nr:MAG: hypothetical protein BWX52_01595 [Bacteroidetes bacterium ADurb.Bin013]
MGWLDHCLKTFNYRKHIAQGGQFGFKSLNNMGLLADVGTLGGIIDSRLYQLQDAFRSCKNEFRAKGTFVVKALQLGTDHRCICAHLGKAGGCGI